MRRKLPMHIGEMSSVPECGHCCASNVADAKQDRHTNVWHATPEARARPAPSITFGVERYARPRCPNRVEPYAKSTPTARAANAGIPRLESSGTAAHAGLTTAATVVKTASANSVSKGGHLISAPRNACPTARPSLPRCRTASSTATGASLTSGTSRHM